MSIDHLAKCFPVGVPRVEQRGNAFFLYSSENHLLACGTSDKKTIFILKGEQWYKTTRETYQKIDADCKVMLMWYSHWYQKAKRKTDAPNLYEGLRVHEIDAYEPLDDVSYNISSRELHIEFPSIGRLFFRGTVVRPQLTLAFVSDKTKERFDLRTINELKILLGEGDANKLTDKLRKVNLESWILHYHRCFLNF